MAHETLRERWGQLVKARRIAYGLSQMALAIEVGVYTSTVSRVESGEIAATDDLRIRLASALGVRVEELFPYPDTTQAAS